MGNDEDDEKKKSSLRVEVNTPRYNRWSDAADERDQSLSDLVRTAIDLYLDDEWVLESDVEQQANTDEIEDRLANIEDRLDELSLDATPADTETPAADLDRTELLSLAEDVRELLPVVADADEFSAQISVGMINRPCHVQHLTERLDTGEERVRRALIFLKQTKDVDSVRINGERGWFRILPDPDSESESDSDNNGDKSVNLPSIQKSSQEMDAQNESEHETDDTRSGEQTDKEFENPEDVFQ